MSADMSYEQLKANRLNAQRSTGSERPLEKRASNGVPPNLIPDIQRIRQFEKKIFAKQTHFATNSLQHL
jgi:hypothetical protein